MTSPTPSVQSGVNPALRQLRSIARTLLDVGLASGAMLGAVRWRHDFLNEPIINNIDHVAAIITAFATLLVWAIMRQDRAIWRFTTLNDFRKLLAGVALVFLIVPLIIFFGVDRGANFPRSAPFIAAAVFAGAIVLTRLAAMILQNGDFRALFRSPSTYSQDALLIGPAPHLYNFLNDRARRRDRVGFNPVGLIETTGAYQNRSIRSVPVLGSPNELREIYRTMARRNDRPLQLISVDPAPDRAMTAQLLKIASDLGAPLGRNTPGVGQGLSAFEAADLIGRDMRRLDLTPVRHMFAGRRVLVTGAGGSIGSELSQQIAALDPAQLSLVDHSELHLYELEKRLIAATPETQRGRKPVWKTFIGDVRNAPRLQEIFSVERPDIVLHAAALKHVPIGERNPLEVLRTNVMGTYHVLDACEAYGVGHFILISTDKAVSPVNMMGASKRIVEMLTLARQAQHPTLQASVVRFGNVLASNGSVVNLFEEQIAAGGPVTVTHREVDRYFMMVEEASALVLQAAALGGEQMRARRRDDAVPKASGCIYVLEMGEPVNIARLARQLIRLRGKVPDVDIDIKYTGLRPGEKLTEVLSYDDENLIRTSVDGVLRYTGSVSNAEAVLSRVRSLIRALNRRDRSRIRKLLAQLVPGYDAAPVLAEPDLALVDVAANDGEAAGQ